MAYRRFLFSCVVSSVALWLGLSGVARADFAATAWRWHVALRGDVGGGEYVTVELPARIFSYLKPDLADLRVVRDGQELPYVLAVESEQETVANVPARLYNLSSDAVTVSFTLDVGVTGTLHDSVTLDTTSENFRRGVSVEGSDDEVSWRTLTSTGHIFDYTVRDTFRPVAVRDTRVDYPEAVFRYLRVTVQNAGEAPLSIRGATVHRRVSAPAHEVTYEPTTLVREDSAARATEVVADLGVAGVPHRQADVATEDENFNRAVAVYDSADGSDWRLLTHDYIFAITTPTYVDRKLTVRYPESNRRYLKLAVLNNDDRPVTVSAVRLRGVVRRLLLPAGTGTYQLYLGNPTATHPRYDIAQRAQYVDLTTVPRLTVGSVEANAAYVAPLPPALPWSERLPYVLPAALAGIVLVLGWLLYRLVRSTKGL